jgi:hypothetical protein
LITGVHVSFDPEHVPEDLVFRDTGDRQIPRKRCIVRRHWREARAPGNLTCWSIDDIRSRVEWLGGGRPDDLPWWRRLRR